MKTILPTRDVVKKHEKSTNKAMSLFEKTMKKLMVEDNSIEVDMAKEQAKIDKAIEKRNAMEVIQTRVRTFHKKLASFMEE